MRARASPSNGTEIFSEKKILIWKTKILSILAQVENRTVFLVESRHTAWGDAAILVLRLFGVAEIVNLLKQTCINLRRRSEI